MEKSLSTNLLGITRRYWRRLGIALAMVMVSNGLQVFNPLIFRQAVLSINPQNGETGNGIPALLASSLGAYAHHVPVWVVILLFVALISAYFQYRMRVEFVAISRDVEREVRSRLFDRLQGQSRAFYDRHHIGDLMSMLTNDISAYRDVLGPGIMYPLCFVTLAIPALVALASISPLMTLPSLLPILLLPLFVLVTQNRVYARSREVQDILGEMSTFAQEHFSAARLIKSMAKEEVARVHFDALGMRYFHLNLWLAALRGLFFPFLTLFTKLITVVLVLFAGYSLYFAWTDLSSADFVSFMWIQATIFGPVLMLGWVLPMYQRGGAAYDRMVRIYEEPIEVSEGPNNGLEVAAEANIAFHNLSFTYSGANQPALKNISLEIPAGSFLGITGPLASGKTTLLRLLNREYEIPRGMITLGGRDIHEYGRETLHRSMAVVEQAPFLFSKSVADNVGMAQEAPSIEEIEQVARLADLHESVLAFPMQYDTVVGERGVRLSGGQKQRVAIARAFLAGRSILLLDDIFSAVDAATEQRIFGHMRGNFSGKTVILVTHRAPLLQQMDRILYMSDGFVVEDGSHAELMALGGRYAALVELQSLETGKEGR